MDNTLFEVKDLEVNYGLIQAVKGISFKIDKGSIVSLIGANGAGKTTTLHALSGLLKHKGQIYFEDKDITHLSSDKKVSLGIVQVPERRRIFANLTVIENLEMGAYLRRDKEEIKKDLDKVFTSFPRLKERKEQLGGTLSGGEQQMLAIARALMSKPKLLLLDEPSMGLSPLLVKEIFNIILDINNKEGVTVLLVEQNAKMALSISDHAYALENGKIVTSGSGKELLNSEDIKKAYLGE